MRTAVSVKNPYSLRATFFFRVERIFNLNRKPDNGAAVCRLILAAVHVSLTYIYIMHRYMCTCHAPVVKLSDT